MKDSSKVAAFLDKISSKLSVLVPRDTTETVDEAAFTAQLRAVFEQLGSVKLHRELLAGFEGHAATLWTRYQGSEDSTAAPPSKKRRRDAPKSGDSLSAGAERLLALVTAGRSPSLIAEDGGLRITARSFDPEAALAQLTEAVEASRDMLPSAASACTLSAFLNHFTCRLSSTATASPRTRRQQRSLAVTLLLHYLSLFPTAIDTTTTAVTLDVGAFVEQCHVVLGALGEAREGSVALIIALAREAASQESPNAALMLVIDRALERLSRAADMGTPLSSEHLLRLLLPFAVLAASSTARSKLLAATLTKSLVHLGSLPLSPPLIAWLKERKGTAVPTAAGVLRLKLSPIDLNQALAHLTSTAGAADAEAEEEEEEEEEEEGAEDGGMDDLFFIDNTGTSELSGSIASMIKDMPTKKVVAGGAAVEAVEFAEEEEDEDKDDGEEDEDEDKEVQDDEDQQESDEDEDEEMPMPVSKEASTQRKGKSKSPSLARTRTKRASATPQKYSK
jgi:hypothetical protein